MVSVRIKKRPRILLTPSTQAVGEELPDHAISVSSLYFQAIIDAGGLPFSLPLTTDREVLTNAVRQAHGILLTGGDDILPKIYWPDVPPKLAKTCMCAEPARDVMELELVHEIFRQGTPLLAICRGHQLVNVALGGTLFVDLPSQYPSQVRHRRLDQRMSTVHEINLKSGSNLSKITGCRTLGVNSTHHQGIDRVAEPLEPVGHAPDGIVEAMELRKQDQRLLRWFLSVQFHPERLYMRYPEHGSVFKTFVSAAVREAARNRN